MGLNQDNIIMLPYLLTSCQLTKVNIENGSFEIEKTISSLSGCKGLTLSPSGDYIYVAGFSGLGSSLVVRLNYSDFSYVSSKRVTTPLITSIYAYSHGGISNAVLVNSLTSSVSGVYQFTAINMSAFTSAKLWSKSLECSGSCTSTSEPSFTLLSTNNNIALVAVMENDSPVLFIIGLASGNIQGSFYTANLGKSNMQLTDLASSTVDKVVLILIKHEDGFHEIEYDFSQDLFTSSHSNPNFSAYFIEMIDSFVYYGGIQTSNGKPSVSKLMGDGDVVPNSALLLTSTPSETFAAEASRYSFDDTSLVVTTSLSLIPLIDTVLGVIDYGTETVISVTESVSDLVFPESFDEVFYIQENKIANIDYGYVCSIGAVTNILYSISDHPDGYPRPSWVDLSSNGTQLIAQVPEYVEGASTFYFGIQSSIISKVISKTLTLIVFVCRIAN